MRGGVYEMLADASYCCDLGVAGIGVAFKGDGRIVCADAIRARDINDAEFLAAIRACQMLAVRQAAAGSRVYTDSHTVARLTNQKRGDRYGCAADLRKMLADHGWHLIEVHRGQVKAAHTIAHEALQIWRAGRAQSATWLRTPYIKDPVPA